MLRLGKLAARIIAPGTPYGVAQTSTTYPLIEFLDTRITGRDPVGQVIARMHVEHLFLMQASEGITLDERVPLWALSASQVRTVREYIEQMGVRDACVL